MKSNETLKLKMGTALMALGVALSVGSVINTAQAKGNAKKDAGKVLKEIPKEFWGWREFDSRSCAKHKACGKDEGGALIDGIYADAHEFMVVVGSQDKPARVSKVVQLSPNRIAVTTGRTTILVKRGDSVFIWQRELTGLMGPFNIEQ